ncbi:hypothetical protein CLOP_g21729 [Closterium sp. NIES-67]|nr:hypothetical protein CLOP_g21729 [Closterium sp. NIES-67]
MDVIPPAVAAAAAAAGSGAAAGGDGGGAGDAATLISAEIAHTIMGLQLGVFLFSVCHLVIVLCDGLTDRATCDYIQAVQMLRLSPSESPWGPSKAVAPTAGAAAAPTAAAAAAAAGTTPAAGTVSAAGVSSTAGEQGDSGGWVGDGLVLGREGDESFCSDALFVFARVPPSELTPDHLSSTLTHLTSLLSHTTLLTPPSRILTPPLPFTSPPFAPPPLLPLGSGKLDGSGGGTGRGRGGGRRAGYLRGAYGDGERGGAYCRVDSGKAVDKWQEGREAERRSRELQDSTRDGGGGGEVTFESTQDAPREWGGSSHSTTHGSGGSEDGSVSFWVLPSEDPWAWAEDAAVSAALGGGGGGGGAGGAAAAAVGGGGSGMGSLGSYRLELKNKILGMQKKLFPEPITEREWAMRAAAAWGGVRMSPLIAQFAHFLQASPLFQQP